MTRETDLCLLLAHHPSTRSESYQYNDKEDDNENDIEINKITKMMKMAMKLW